MKFIAEIGLNYNGHFNLCYELIRQAKYAGADIAKFQLGWRCKEDEMNFLDEARIEKLIQWTNYFDIELMFSIIIPEAFDLLSKYDMKRMKVASRTVRDDLPLVQKIVDLGKNTIISLGMWDKEELPLPKTDNIDYLFCISKYPCEPWDMQDFPKAFGKGHKYEGYSDHTIGIDAVLLAIARGATIIEKHFTLDKSDTTIRDHALSATPEEFTLMTQIGRELHKKVQLGI